MDFTGERYIPELDWPEISYEHWHRYMLAETLAEGKTVLDVACGEGYGASRLARKASRVVGVDISAEAIAHARSAYGAANIDFIEGSADRLPIEGEAIFDLVTSFETIEHIPEDAQVRFLDEIKRVIKPTGACVVSSPNKYEYSDKNNTKNPYHLKEFQVDEFMDFMRRRFRFVEALGQRVYPVSYLWPLAPARAEGPMIEHQIEFDRGAFKPVEQNEKACLYVIVIASDAPIVPLAGSILVDISSRAVNARLGEVMSLKHDVEQLYGHIARAMNEIERLNRECESHRAELEAERIAHQSAKVIVDEFERLSLLKERRVVGARFDAVSLRHENELLREELNKVYASKSWKIVHHVKSMLRRA